MIRLQSTRQFPVISCALLIIVFALFSCAGKDVEDPAEPEIAREASIPAQVAEPDPEPPAELPILKKDEHETLEKPEPIEEPRTVRTSVKKKPEQYKENWFLVTEVKGDRAYTVYVDTGSIEDGAKGLESWSKLVFEQGQRDDDGLYYHEVQISSSIDCYEKTYAYNTSKFYDSIGRLVYQEDISYNPNPITPDSLSAYLADFVCGYVYEENG